MLLYLVRHGKAEQIDAGEDDGSRRLTDEGRAGVERVARRLRKAGLRVDRVFCSPAVRAKQTAEILVEAVGGELSATRDLLAPEIAPMLSRLRRESGDLMLVGHMPFMGLLASRLLTGHESPEIVHFRTGAIICLSDEEGRWQLEWFVSPKLA
jgi:phosphohistidine phosphatase